MTKLEPKTIYLKDYKIPNYLIDNIYLTVELKNDITKIKSEINFRKNPLTDPKELPELILDGKELQLEKIELENKTLTKNEYTCNDKNLILQPKSIEFTTKIITSINPHKNTALEGLYKSGNMYCTQCEAQGFRRITYYLDRPDVMAKFKVKIIADKTSYPVLLSNGNNIEEGDLSGNRHFKMWHDPFAKPCYLFALVAGNLKFIEDYFITKSNRKITLQIFTEKHNIDKCNYAMLSLKKAMKWDEKIYGREYDLDIFMIVAVDSFNMGAMENKGLNIFNSACVLASPKTASDATFQNIEGIVAHEYFHNWSGNRVTCRDWFQLSLKEGFTVFRDQEFSADMNSRPVKRIQDVSVLRNIQFSEDAGPMSHPVRPESFIEISNFYTSTIYDKGAEVIRMLYHILGKNTFRKGCDLYFKKHDGQAVTCDDFVKAMEDVSEKDFTQFKYWYSQSGTPTVTTKDSYNEQKKTYTITFSQSNITAGEQNNLPFHIPIKIGLIDKLTGKAVPLDDKENKEKIINLKTKEETFTFKNIYKQPIPSILRGFSAPIKLKHAYTHNELLTLILNDTDDFNRWSYIQQLSLEITISLFNQHTKNKNLVVIPEIIAAFKHVLLEDNKDKSITAEMLKLPSVLYIGGQMETINPLALFHVRNLLKTTIAELLHKLFLETYNNNHIVKEYKPTAHDISERSLKNIALSWLSENKNTAVGFEIAQNQYKTANNMTDSIASLNCMINTEDASNMGIANMHLKEFSHKWKNDSNVMNTWFSLQARAKSTDVKKIKTLQQHSCFNFKNPNNVRSLIGAFCGGNIKGFHQQDGSGYNFLAETIINMDKINPQIASRLISPLTKWKQFSETYQNAMKNALYLIKDKKSLSPDLYEVVTKSIGK